MNDDTFPGDRLLDPARFEREVDGQPVRLFTLRNSRGMVAAITNYGAKIEQLVVPDRQGRFDDVVLGYDSLEGVIGGSPSMGAFVGRYAGRLANARFTLAGSDHVLSANNGKHCLHGGLRGSRFRVFEAEQHDESSVEMRYVFADGEEGFPGTLALHLTYRVTEANELLLDYEALALDKPTVASFTTHAFFNLNGEAGGSALGHEVMICADRHFAMNAELVATGEILPVEQTLFDFRRPTVLNTRVRGVPPESGAGLNATGEWVDGYDCCYLVNRSPSDGLALCARVRAPESGRVMEVWSTEPAMQFYTGLLPQEPLPGGHGKRGWAYFQQQGLCFEPQGYPNAPNRPEFPSAVYQPGQSRHGRTLYRFSTAP
ncbi:aldose epimerase family protein [Polaromonas jejuensis]|uniref:Aldose 1-epimerase n=1 Tax=Polaromonas jejuensis TaxID=457502 RepID=A0ABW0QEY4_9BURK|nr:aldose epimerase family protein [Polaromonas jejuensis]